MERYLYRFMIVDVPGAYSTTGESINNRGEIAGFYTLTRGGVFHSFLREPDGTYLLFDVPGSAMTLALGLNNLGDIVGTWFPDITSNTQHGFLRNADGEYTSLDVLGSLQTEALSLNDAGEILLDGTAPKQALLRSADGTEYGGISIPGSTEVIAFGINNSRQIVGSVVLAGTGGPGVIIQQGFLLSFDIGLSMVYNFPGSSVSSTVSKAINNEGDIVGSYTTWFRGTQRSHGFVRDPAGLLHTIDYPGLNDGTILNGINDIGEIVGNTRRTPSWPFRFRHRLCRDPEGNPSTGSAIPLRNRRPQGKLDSERLKSMESPPRGAQYDPHNKQPANARRIRFSWLVILLIFIALGITAVLIAMRTH